MAQRFELSSAVTSDVWPHTAGGYSHLKVFG